MAKAAVEVDAAIALGSASEVMFLETVVPDLPGPGAARWFIPEPSMAQLLGADVTDDYRRPDFVVSPPGTSLALVVEIDGPQHDDARRVDAARDRALVSAGFSVLRIPVNDLRRPTSASLGRLRDAWPRHERVDDRIAAMAIAPIDAARCALALLIGLTEPGREATRRSSSRSKALSAPSLCSYANSTWRSRSIAFGAAPSFRLSSWSRRMGWRRAWTASLVVGG